MSRGEGKEMRPNRYARPTVLIMVLILSLISSACVRGGGTSGQSDTTTGGDAEGQETARASGDETTTAGDTDTGGSITLWYATHPLEETFAKEIVAEWNSSHDVKVNAQPVPAGNSTEEVMLAAIAAKSTPDVLTNGAASAVPQYREGGALVNLSETFEDAESFLKERSGEEVLDQYRSDDGDLYQIPWKFNPVMLFYNKQMFKKAGLDPNKPPRTYSELLDAMGKLKDSGITPIQPSIDQTWWQRLFDWYPLYLAAGDQLLLDEDATKPIFNNEAGREAMGFWREVYAKGYAPKATAEQDPFSQGKVALRLAGPWAMPEMEKAGILKDVGVTTIPVPDDHAGDDVTTFADSKSIVMFQSSENKEASWEFIKFYLSPENEAKFLKDTQEIPFRQNIVDLVGKEYFDEHPLLHAFAEQVGHTLDVDASPKLIDVFTIISQAYQSAAIYGKQPVDRALAEAEDKVNRLLGAE
jgi:multiple sugar transport system substrate-binding protein